MSTPRFAAVSAVSALALLATAVGCASYTPRAHEPGLAPRTLAQVQTDTSTHAVAARRPTVALVLGGGGLRGFAHVGVLRALEAAARRVDLSSLADWTLSARGFIRGDAIAEWIDAVTNHTPVERFPIRFAAVATGLRRQQVAVLDSGSAGRAIQASAAVPGVSLPAVVSQVMRAQSCRLAEIEKAAADVLITPAVGAVSMTDRARHEHAIAVGYAAARAALAAPRLSSH